MGEEQTTWWWCINHGKLEGAQGIDGRRQCSKCHHSVYLGLKDGTPHNPGQAKIKNEIEQGIRF